MVVDAIGGIRTSEYKSGFGMSNLVTDPRLPSFMYPVSAIVADPSCPPSEHCTYRTDNGQPEEDWFLVAEVHIAAPGQYRTAGVRLTYQVKGDSSVYYQDFPAKIELDSGADTLPGT